MHPALSVIALAIFSTIVASASLSSGAAAEGSCTNPTIRKEWRTLTKAEKTNWISAVKCLANLPALPLEGRELTRGVGAPEYNASGSLYDDFVFLHINLADKVHRTGLLYPWHRWYVKVYEDILRARCGLTTPSPYWDWRKDYTDVKTGTLFSDVDPESGIGGWGAPEGDYQIKEGAFAKDFRLSYPIPHGLRRNYTATFIDAKTDNDTGESLLGMITPEAVEYLLNQEPGNFTALQLDTEKRFGTHNAGHFLLGGDLSGKCPQGAPDWCYVGAGNPFWSANEPMFWLHHGMVDKLWADWQAKSNLSVNAFAGGSVKNVTYFPTGAPPMLSLDSVMPTDGIGQNVTVGDVMSTTGGFLCYRYE